MESNNLWVVFQQIQTILTTGCREAFLTDSSYLMIQLLSLIFQLIFTQLLNS